MSIFPTLSTRHNLKRLDSSADGSPVVPASRDRSHVLVRFLLTCALIFIVKFAHQHRVLANTLKVEIEEAREFFNDLNAIIPLKMSCFTPDCTVDLLHKKFGVLNDEVEFLSDANDELAQLLLSLHKELYGKNTELDLLYTDLDIAIKKNIKIEDDRKYWEP